MKITQNLFDIKKASLLALMLPYIGFNWVELYQSPSFNIKYVLILFGILSVIEISFKSLLKFEIFSSYFAAVFISLTLIFFTGIMQYHSYKVLLD